MFKTSLPINTPYNKMGTALFDVTEKTKKKKIHHLDFSFSFFWFLFFVNNHLNHSQSSNSLNQNNLFQLVLDLLKY